MNNSTIAQRQCLLVHLQTHGRITTTHARDDLDIYSPAPRVYDLRHLEGWNIATFRQTTQGLNGKRHRVADYVLLSGNSLEERQARRQRLREKGKKS